MAPTLKTLIVKLRRHRRKSRSRELTGGETAQNNVVKQYNIAQQMEGLTIGSSPAEQESSTFIEPDFRFGDEADFDFDFCPPAGHDWPGPAYDESARFAPGVLDKARTNRPKTKHRSPKRKLSHPDHTRIPPRSSATHAQERVVTDTAKNRLSSRPRPMQYYGSPPTRDEPLTLLTLPGEIRNQILRLIVLDHNPLIAQYKPIIAPKKGPENPDRVTVKRFPREPVLAITNQQLRKEVLSIFYGANKFVIRQTENLDLKCHTLFKSESLDEWASHSVSTKCLTHVEVEFTARVSLGLKHTIKYVLRDLGDRGLSITMKLEHEDYCTCFDEEFLRCVKAQREGKGGTVEDMHLMDEVRELIRERRERLMQHDGFLLFAEKFRVIGWRCKSCDKEHVRALEVGP